MVDRTRLGTATLTRVVEWQIDYLPLASSRRHRPRPGGSSVLWLDAGMPAVAARGDAFMVDDWLEISAL